MKPFAILLFIILLSGCTIQFEGKDLKLDAKPAEPGLKFSMASAEFDPINYLKNGD